MAALKPFSLIFSSALLILLLLPLLSANATNSPNSHDKIASPFEFLKGLQGCQKGNKTRGIRDLKKYLKQFGYLSYNHSNDDDFDDVLESAVKTYQLNYHLNATGTLDDKTVSTMIMPRCGVPDIINSTNWMHLEKKWHQDGHGSFHTVSHYAFFPRNPKWPPSKYHLTYGFVEGTSTIAINAVVQAFQAWASRTHFTFSLVQRNGLRPDITIGFFRRDHGDGLPFDGAGGLLAHAFAPTDGRLHYDGDERWTVGAVKGAFDLQTVAMHEIGHNLGLQHSSVREAIMFPYISPGTTKGLHPDDIEGIKVLYNK
jgi:peptidoglycan hydrolase-like protein with peptidoglycan-binding domain